MTEPAWRPGASVEVLRGRAAMLARIRAYFAAQGVLEVQTPVLSAAAVSDPQIESISASPARGPRLFLQTSPEYPMKRLLAAGFGDCYQVCPVFRDGESGRLHNPEFTCSVGYDQHAACVVMVWKGYATTPLPARPTSACSPVSGTSRRHGFSAT